MVTHNLAAESYVLPPDEVDPTRDITILLPNVDPLNCVLQQQVSWGGGGHCTVAVVEPSVGVARG